jgi:putative Mg2+ transporter-C (MgtC) family protein
MMHGFSRHRPAEAIAMTLELFGQVFDFSFLRELTIAYLLALPIAIDRERSQRSAGLRTFPIVSLACCAFLLLSRDIFGGNTEALARVFYGLMTGIGFIGGGAIVKQGGTAHGTATAAGIWSTGALGAAVAFQHYGMAVALAFITFLTFWIFKPIKHVLADKNESDPGAEDCGES